MKKYTVKINGKEFSFEDISTALDLVEVTYFSCRVVFCDSEWETGITINTIVDFTELCEMYD